MRDPRLPLFVAACALAATFIHPITLAAQTTPVPCSGGYVGLRFDDGPFDETSAILDLLKQYHLHATFFVVGSQAQQYPDTIRRMIAEGHAIANHTWDHVDLSTLSVADIDYQLSSTQNLIKQITGGYTPKFAGPPYGGSSDTVRAEMAKYGLTEVLKSWDSGDWDGAEEWQVFNQLTLVPPGGIILMHDWSPIAQEVIPDVDWYFNTYWKSSPICSGRIAASPSVNPVLDWLGQYYHATVTKW
jgi:peptidoglycan/xylan/chitin deacetylase (PgdA/CDA1 family)